MSFKKNKNALILGVFLLDKNLTIVYYFNMKVNQSKEDYLETILVLSKTEGYVHQIDIARKMGVSQPAVKKAIKILQAESYIKLDGLHIYLTDLGVKYAKTVYKRHKIIKDFLIKLGVLENIAEEDACRIEHVISKETFIKIQEFLK